MPSSAVKGYRPRPTGPMPGGTARFGQQKQPAPSPVLPENARDLKELVECREDLTKRLVMTKNRLHVASSAVPEVHEATIAFLTDQIAGMDQRIVALIAAATLAERRRMLRSVPGIGPECGSDRRLAGAGGLGRQADRRPGRSRAASARLRDPAQDPGDPGRPPRDPQGALSDGPYRRARRSGDRRPLPPAAGAAPRQGGRDRLRPAHAGAPHRDGLTWQQTQVAHGRFLPPHPLTSNTVTTTTVYAFVPSNRAIWSGQPLRHALRATTSS